MSDIIQLNCSDEINTFQTEVVLEFRGDLDAVTEAEKNRTESGFAITYNGLSETVCDPFFREVIDAVITSTEEVTGRERSLQTADRLFRFTYTITGRARGSGERRTLFDDAVAKRGLVELPCPEDTNRLLQVDTPPRNCTCPADVVDIRRAPSESEYTVEYNHWLERMFENGNIDPEHIEVLLETVELTSATSGAASMPLNSGLVVGQLFLLILFLIKVIL